MSNAQIIGSVGTLPLAPYVADRWGRRLPIFLGSLVIIAAAAIQGSSSTIAQFIVGRVLVGVGNHLIGNACPPLIVELAYPTQRPVISALYNTAWVRLMWLPFLLI